MKQHLAFCFSGQIPVLDLTDVQLCLPEQSRTVPLYSSDMIGVLMGNEDVLNG